MKRTSLYETHKAAGATLVPFAGWEMPVSYSGTVAEVAAVRTSAGIFDVSHMGEVIIEGEGAFDFVQSVTTNDVSKVIGGKPLPFGTPYEYRPGRAQYSLLLNKAGGVIDDIIVYGMNAEKYLLVLNAGCKEKDWDWLQLQAAGRSDIELRDVSDYNALIAVQGPDAVKLVEDVMNKPGQEIRNETDYDLQELRRFRVSGIYAYDVQFLVSRTGYTGEDGFEIFCDPEDAPLLWQLMTDAGATPAGLGARDVLRLEAAYPLYGHELDAETSPFESGVGWAVKMNKGEFIGRAALEAGSRSQQLVGLQMDERAIPREHYAVTDADGNRVGETTSGTWSPTVKAGIAMARVNVEAAALGTKLFVDIRGRKAPATITKLPFYRNGV